MKITNELQLTRISFRGCIGLAGVAISIICSVILALAMAGVLTGFDQKIMHQSGIRWISEGAVSGMLLAAVAFWQD